MRLASKPDAALTSPFATAAFSAASCCCSAADMALRYESWLSWVKHFSTISTIKKEFPPKIGDITG